MACSMNNTVFQTALIKAPPVRRQPLSGPSLTQAAAAAASSQSVTVVGGGAAGLTAAYFAAQGGARVTVLERTEDAGKKILISGGTRCNILPVSVDVERDFFSDSSLLALRGIFATWPLDDCKEWLEDEVGLRLATEAHSNKYFPASNSSAEVRNKLVASCQRNGVQFVYSAKVEGLQQDLSQQQWACQLQSGSLHHSDAVVLATGGLSFPRLGTDGTGHRLAEALGHKLVAPYPALTPLTGAHPGRQQLAGISLDVALQCRAGKGGKKGARRSQRAGLLLTHRGFSGPSVLDLSHLAVRALEAGASPLPAMQVNWTGEDAAAWEARLQGAGGRLVLPQLRQAGLPARLAEALCAEAGVAPSRRLAELSKAERRCLLDLLTSYSLQYDGHEGYAKAEVTGGGVPLSQINCGTMESRSAPGLHLCGEIVDVFGRIGGFNFLWAWVSGRLAGRSAARTSL